MEVTTHPHCSIKRGKDVFDKAAFNSEDSFNTSNSSNSSETFNRSNDSSMSEIDSTKYFSITDNRFRIELNTSDI